jgi:hypothetical protein
MPRRSDVIKELIALKQRESERIIDLGTLPGFRLSPPSFPARHRRAINAQVFGQILLV